MLRLNRLAFLLLACCFHFFCAAQTTSCSADFSYSVGNNNTVSFFAKDSLGASHHWSFGDGTQTLISANGMPTHQYARPGQYEVKHFIEKPNSNCRDSVVKIITVEGIDQCQAAFGYKKIPGTLSYQFLNSSASSSGIKESSWNFGDGTTSGDFNPTHTFTTAGTYTVCLNIVSNNGCKSSYCSQLLIIDSNGSCNIFTKFQYSKDSIDCKKIHFSNQPVSATANMHFTWNFGDGSTSHDINPSHLYSQAGKYRVCLVSEVDSSCRKEYCDTVTVNCESACAIVNKFQWKNDPVNCKNVYFSNISAPISSITHFTWNFGDGTTSRDLSPAHIYAQPGKYYVCLASETGSNCRKEYCDSVTVNCDSYCNITAKYEYRKDSLDCKKIHFINQSVSSAANIHFTWNFGDGSTSHDINPVHIYTQPGKYDVCLVSESGTNCRKEFCDSITINCSTCTVSARFEAQHDATSWNTIHFNNLSNPVSTIWQTYWYYGDGASSHDYNSFHTYDKPGVYNVCLKVIGLNGCLSYYCDTVRVVKQESCTLIASFSHYSSSTNPLTLKFEALYQNNTNTAAYYWNFGDSTSGIGRIAYHVYNKPGKYNVCLTVKDRQCSATHCEEIPVEKPANGGRMVVYPNPAVNTVSFDIALDRPGQLSIRFFDGSGAVRSEFSRTGVSGSNRFTLPVEKLSQGIYLVEIKSNTGAWFSRFVKG